MSDLRICRVPPALFNHLSLAEVAELERLKPLIVGHRGGVRVTQAERRRFIELLARRINPSLVKRKVSIGAAP